MNITTQYQLKRNAVRLFPHTSYTDRAAVKHNRHGWMNCVQYLRNRKDESTWILDKPVPRNEAI